MTDNWLIKTMSTGKLTQAHTHIGMQLLQFVLVIMSLAGFVAQFT